MGGLQIDAMSTPEEGSSETLRAVLWSNDKTAPGETPPTTVERSIRGRPAVPFIVVHITWFVPTTVDGPACPAVCVRALEISAEHFYAFIDAAMITKLTESITELVTRLASATASIESPHGGDVERANPRNNSVPLFIEQMSIAPIHATVTARASVGVYVSVDDAVLKFGGISVEDIFGCPQGRIGKAIGDRCVSPFVPG